MSARGLIVSTLVSIGASAAESRDPVLEGLVVQALEARPELVQAKATLEAASERVSREQAWPDPMLQVGVQNDGFTRWSVGRTEMSWVSFMASQTIPLGTPGPKGELAKVEVSQRELALDRVRLSTIAEVRRAYLSLQLANARLELLTRQRGLLDQAVEVARARYESGEGSQADQLRARLEVGRLEQRQEMGRADVALALQTLNRFRSAPLDASVSARPFSELTFPPVHADAEVLALLREQSPEYRSARLATDGAKQVTTLARRQIMPELVVGAGVMVRGGLEPMWTVTLGVPLPVFAATKQARAVSEAEALERATTADVTTVEQVMALRTAQRAESLRRLRGVWELSRTTLLRDADATAEATLAQYRVGKVPFAAVLEAATLSVSLLDESFQVLADAWRLSIAQDELALGEPPSTFRAAQAPSSSTGM